MKIVPENQFSGKTYFDTIASLGVGDDPELEAIKARVKQGGSAIGFTNIRPIFESENWGQNG